MSNIIKLAPYAYLAKRSGSGTLYDLLILVPVNASGDTDLSNVTAVKPSGTRITIDYTTTGSASSGLYRSKHFAIDSDGTFLDIKIQGDNNADRTTVVTFADADTEPATVSNQQQTCAPYVFAKMETDGSLKYIQPSCIILFDTGIGAQSESIIFAPYSCIPTITLGNSSPTTDPTKFVINQNVKMTLTPNQVFSFEGNVLGNSNFSKPPRKAKMKMIWSP